MSLRRSIAFSSTITDNVLSLEAMLMNDAPILHVRDVTATAKTKPERNASDRLPKTLVIYFPQYHKERLNDENWGENFTDWVSLNNAPEKNKVGNIIPRPLLDPVGNSSDLPPPLGYYDLTHRKPRETQGILAKKYGIDGFIYHHYWFYDVNRPGPTLEKPLVKMLEDGHPDVPFLLNWCSTKWVNVWMGRVIYQKGNTNKNNAILIQDQFFNATQDMIYQHYQWLKPFFHHPNYIRVDGQPAFFTYQYHPEALPILESLRRFAIQDGFPGLHLIFGRSSNPEELYNTSHLPDDKNTLHKLKHRDTREDVDPTKNPSSTRSIYWKPPPNASAYREWYQASKKTTLGVPIETWDYNPGNQTMTYPYPLDIINKPFEVPEWCTKPTKDSSSHLESNAQQHPEIIGVITTFDNTPRRPNKEATVWNPGDSPDEAIERFAKSYRAALYYQKCCVTGGTANGDDRFVAINAMNEWAEGMSIEPSQLYGYRWLETIQAVQKQVEEESCVRG